MLSVAPFVPTGRTGLLVIRALALAPLGTMIQADCLFLLFRDNSRKNAYLTY